MIKHSVPTINPGREVSFVLEVRQRLNEWVQDTSDRAGLRFYQH